MSKHYLVCVDCGRDYPLSTVNARCRRCDEPLEVRFDAGRLPGNWWVAPPSGNQVLRKLSANHGHLLKVKNEAVLRAMRLLAQEGVFVQPASATALAGLIQAVNKNMIPAGSWVVVVVTGSGLKYPPVLKEFDLSPVSVDLDHLPQALETTLNEL